MVEFTKAKLLQKYETHFNILKSSKQVFCKTDFNKSNIELLKKRSVRSETPKITILTSEILSDTAFWLSYTAFKK